MKLALIWSVLFLSGIMFGYYFGSPNKSSSKTYKLPASLKLQVKQVVNRDPQVQARYRGMPEIYYRVRSQI